LRAEASSSKSDVLNAQHEVGRLQQEKQQILDELDISRETLSALQTKVRAISHWFRALNGRISKQKCLTKPSVRSWSPVLICIDYCVPEERRKLACVYMVDAFLCVCVALWKSTSFTCLCKTWWLWPKTLFVRFKFDLISLNVLCGLHLHITVMVWTTR